MPDYQASRLIDVAPDDVFLFVSDVGTLPDYVPTVRAASRLPNGRVRVEGRVGEADYVDDGFLHVDGDRRRLEWRADELDYRGSLEVSDEEGRSRVIVRLDFGVEKIPAAVPSVPDEPLRDAPPLLGPGAGGRIADGLEAALDALHDLLLGRGGKRDAAGRP